MTLPNFLVCGAGKAGTTTLWQVLRGHPEVFMPARKEPNFFISASYPRSTYHRGITWYESLFADASGKKAVGESSQAYFFDPESPRLIHRHVPDARLLFSLRDPVERMYSHYWQERKRGETLPPFAELVATRLPPFDRLVRTSRYATHLARYLDLFLRKQILCLRYEERRDDTDKALRRTCEFLGIAPDGLGDVHGRRYNPAARPRSDAVERVLRSRGLLRVARAFVPGRFVAGGHGLLQRLKGLNRLPFTPPPMPQETRARLLEEFRDEIDRLEPLLDWDLTAWKRVG